MRPLHLKFKGLRSYRAEQEIDFTNISLMAIIGDTGAGKSSILEALCFALYGYTTWNKSDGKLLAAHPGDGTVRAELTFRANGKRWRVVRAVSANDRAPISELTCIDDGVKVSGVFAVRAEVERLVGFEYDAFLKAVVLPQGKFQDLLRAKPGERADILKTALGLEKITEMREHARVKRDQLLPELDRLKAQLETLVKNPDDVIEETAHQLVELAKEFTALNASAATCQQAEAALAEANRQAGEFRAAAERLEQRIPGETEDRYAQLIRRESELTQQLAEIETQLVAATEKESELHAALADADRDGTGVSGAATALKTLRSLQEDLPEVREKLKELAEQNTTIEQDQVQLEERRKNLALLIQATTDTESAVSNAESALGAALSNLELQRQLVRDAREAQQKSVNAAAGLRTARSNVPHEDVLIDANLASTQADEQVEEAEMLLDTTRRRNSAAHAAEQHKPGDPCPVCVRPLPADFIPPQASDLGDANNALKTARQRAKRKAAELSAAQIARDTAQSALATAANAAEQAATQWNTAKSALTAAIGETDLDQPDESILATAIAGVDEARTANKRAQTAAKEAHKKRSACEAELRSEATNLTRRQKDVTDALASWNKRHTRGIDDYRCLPGLFRDSQEPDTASISKAIDRAERRQRDLATISTAATQARQRIKELNTAKNTRQNEVREQVEKPAGQLATEMRVLADNTSSVPRLAMPVDIPTRPQPVSLTSDAQWARDLVQTARLIIQACHRDATTHTTATQQMRTTIAAVLAEAQVDTPEQLRERLGAVKELTKDVKRTHDQAQIDKPRRAQIERRVSLLQPQIDGLRELATHLAPGKFMRFVVERRQRALLGIATTLLMDMTGKRFAFLDDFMIMDRHTGQPREVITLSGGETFMASLALALALVELTSRGGGRVEALFLDEGFGSLDTNTLSEAMDALTRQAAAGRLVAVITHMRDVAENFDNILVVNKTITGSEAHWADPDEREQMITDGLGGGLLP